MAGIRAADFQPWRRALNDKGFSKLTYLKDLRVHKIGNGAYRVLLAVFNYTDQDGGSAHPGIARLAQDCDMGESTVRRHLTWLKEHGYVVQESRGHSVGDVNLASVYSLALPDLPLSAERKAEVPTAQSVTPTAHSGQTYRSFQTDLPLITERLSDPSPDHLSDPFTSDPPGELDAFDMALMRSREARPEVAAAAPPSRPVVGDEPHCQHCEDSPCNVCGLHFHERNHRYRDPGLNDETKSPGRPSSLPDMLGIRAIRCNQPRCPNTPIANRDYCPMHVVVGRPMASV